MPNSRAPRHLWIAGLVVFCAGPAKSVAAQVRGAYLPLDHPAHAVAEHLVVRGVVRDPTPGIRPLLLVELRTAVADALLRDVGDEDRSRLEWLAGELGLTPESDAWALNFAPEVGLHGATSAVPELLLAESDSMLAPAIRLRVGAEFGPASVQFEPHRLQRGRTFFGAAVARVAWSWGSVEWGKVSRNWGPSRVTGLLVSPLYPSRSEFGFSLGPRALRFEYRVAPLSDGTSPGTSDRVGRWWALHRLAWQPSPGLSLALWETMLAPEPSGTDAARFSPLTPFSFPFQQGIDGGRNVTVGLDAGWRPSAAFGLEAQVVLDDFVLRNRDATDNPYPHRFGYVAQLLGALGESDAWRVYVASLSGLALTTSEADESFIDNGRGLGRLRPDHREVGAFLSRSLQLPAGMSPRSAGIVEVGVKWRRQGVRRFTDPFPSLPTGSPRYPTYSPDIEREVWSLVLDLDWMAGPVTIQTEGQLQRRRFPDAGAGSEWALEGSLELLWRLGNWSGEGSL